MLACGGQPVFLQPERKKHGLAQRHGRSEPNNQAGPEKAPSGIDSVRLRYSLFGS
jgi:hypothetical protein